MEDKFLLFRLVPTMKCNYRCSYCFLPGSEKATNETMFDVHPPQEWVRAMENYRDYEVEFYCWGGEPFLIDGTYELVKGWTDYDHVIGGSRLDTNMHFVQKIAERCPTDKVKLNCSWHTQYNTLDQIYAKIKTLKAHDMVGMLNFVASQRNLAALRDDYGMSIDDLIARFADIDVFVNIAADFAIANDPRSPGYDEYKKLILRYQSPDDWKQLRGEKRACLCEANQHYLTIHSNGDLTPCLSSMVCGNFFEGTIEFPPLEVCRQSCPSLVAYPFRTDNPFPYKRHLVEYVNRNWEYRRSLGTQREVSVHEVRSPVSASDAPKVSVVLPTYNGMKYLPHAVESVLAQTRTDFELIIVNDGSTDGTRAYLDSLNDPRVKVIHQENSRLPSALNAGFSAARGELLSWISSDNYCAPKFLEMFAAALDAHPECGFAYSAFAWVDECDQVTGTHGDQNLSYGSLLAGNPGIASFMYRRSCMEAVGLYDAELEGAEDWDMWLRITRRFRSIYVPDVLYYYRKHDESMTSQMPEKIKATVRATFEKALAQFGDELDLSDLYPAIELCRDQDTANLYACADFGARLLRSPFDAAQEAVRFLEVAYSMSHDRAEIVSNLAVAYARLGCWEQSAELVAKIENAENPYLQMVCRAINNARDTGTTEALHSVPIFDFDRKSVELFQLEDRQRLVFSPSECAPRPAEITEKRPAGDQGIVMIVAPETPSAGILPLATALQAAGYRIKAVHPTSQADRPDYEISRSTRDGVEHVSINCLTDAAYGIFGDQALHNAFGKLLAEEEVDLVHFFHADGSMSPSILEKAQLAGLPTVLTLCDADFIARRDGAGSEQDIAIETAYAKRLADKCSRITAVSPELAAQAQRAPWAGDLSVELLSTSAADAHKWADAYRKLTGDIDPPKTDKVISVVIATYNRPDWLRTCLEGFCNQTLPRENFEIVVVDDHSDDDLSGIIGEFSERLPLKYIRHETNRGLGAARNTGAKTASGDFVAFFDDDDRPARRLLAEHIRTHLAHPEDNAAVLGYTSWDPGLELTPLMYHVTEIGQQYLSYPSIKPDIALPWHCFWGGTASVKRSLLLEVENFDEGTPVCEDMDLAFRLRRTGFKVYYNPKIISFIMRSFDYKAFTDRRVAFGAAAAQIIAKHLSPELAGHFGVGRAADRWDQMKAALPEVENSIEWMQGSDLPTLRARVVATQEGAISAEQLLHQLYYAAFDAYRLKGYADAVTSLRDADASGEAPSVLVVDKCLPYFDRASGSLRMFHVLKSLRELGCSVTFVSMIGSMEEKYAPILESMGIEVHAWDVQALASAGHRQEGIAPLDYESLFGGRKFDYALIEFWDVAQYYMPLLRRYSPDTEIIVDTVDIHFLREIREAELRDSPELKERALANKRSELAVYRQADRLWTVTDQDKREIDRIIGNVPIHVVPNVHSRITEEKSFEDTRDLLFVGNFSHPPNADAVRYFCEEVFPAVTKRIPDARLYVVGGDPPAEVQALASDKVIVAGYVEDLSPYLRAARISVSPLRYGAGMKGKVGEALSWGLPVVTTSIGAEGMDLVDGRDVLIGDTPQDFADRVVTLYNDRDLWSTLSRSGKGRAAEWSPESMTRLLREMLLSRPASPREKLVSIVILAHNQLEYTRQCIASIERHTSVPYELVVVDNGSTDGTDTYLNELEVSSVCCKAVKVIRHETNLGYAAGNNSGIAASTGDYVLLLNNDVVATPGWLERLVAPMERYACVGMAGPVSNCVSGQQMLRSVDYSTSTLDRLDEYASDLAVKHAGEVSVQARLVGFCTLISRSVIEEVGGLDPRYGLGNFEDDDYCVRTAIAGFKCLIAHDCFVHHFGSRTFAGESIDRNKLIMENWSLFKEKWELPSSLQYGRPYDMTALVRQPFDPVRHHCALSGGIDGVRWFVAPNWDDESTWHPIVEEYLHSHMDGDGALLLLYAGRLNGAEAESAYGRVGELLGKLGVDTEEIPNIEITDQLPDDRVTSVILTGGELDDKLRLSCGSRCVEISEWRAAA